MGQGIQVLLAVALVATPLAAYPESVSGQGTWETTLQARDLDGDGIPDAYYDTALNITWLADWNFAWSSGYNSDGSIGGVGMTGYPANSPYSHTMIAPAAALWVETLSVGGVTGWRLPTVSPTSAGGFQYEVSVDGTRDRGIALVDQGWGTASELGHLFYVTLGNRGYYEDDGTSPEEVPPGHGLVNTGPFVNLMSYTYWTGRSYDQYAGWENRINWCFFMAFGYQGPCSITAPAFVVAVRDGDVLPDVARLLQLLKIRVTGVGPGTSLIDKVELAETYYIAEDVQASCAVIEDFVRHVGALAGKKRLTYPEASDIQAEAESITQAIGCD